MDKKAAHKIAKAMLANVFHEHRIKLLAERCGMSVDTVLAWEDEDSEALPNLAEVLLACSDPAIGLRVANVLLACADQETGLRFIEEILCRGALDDAHPTVVANIGAKAVHALERMPRSRFDPSDLRCNDSVYAVLGLAAGAQRMAEKVMGQARALLLKGRQP